MPWFAQFDFEVEVLGECLHRTGDAFAFTVTIDNRGHVVKKDFSGNPAGCFELSNQEVEYILYCLVKFVSVMGVSRIPQFVIKHLKGEDFTIFIGY